MSKYKFFAYDSENGFEKFETAEQAEAHAKECIDWYRGEAADGWPDEVEQVCWGEIKAESTQVDLRKANRDDHSSCEMVCDYALVEVRG